MYEKVYLNQCKIKYRFKKITDVETGTYVRYTNSDDDNGYNWLKNDLEMDLTKHR